VCGDMEKQCVLLTSSPKRYELGELVDWFFRVMRRDEEWGYRRTDLRWSPLFQMRISATQKYCPSWPVGFLNWDKIERVSRLHHNNSVLKLLNKVALYCVFIWFL